MMLMQRPRPGTGAVAPRKTIATKAARISAPSLKRRADLDQEEVRELEQQERRLVRHSGQQQRQMVALLLPPEPPAVPCPDIPSAAHQALLRFLTVNGRASREQVEEFYAETQQRCTHPASKTLPLHACWDHLNQMIQFMQYEIRRIKSEVDDKEYWVLCDNTDRVTQANAASMDVGEDEEKQNRNNASGKPTDASALAKALNPSQFTDKQIAFFKQLLDSILRHQSGQIFEHVAIDIGKMMPGPKNMRLTEDESLFAVHSLIRDGWIRKNTNEVKKGKDEALCLGERTYAELRGYIEEQTQDKKCAACQQHCILGVTCLQQSTDSKRASETIDLSRHACDVKMHYHCARQFFIRRGRDECPACHCKWDRYLQTFGDDDRVVVRGSMGEGGGGRELLSPPSSAIRSALPAVARSPSSSPPASAAAASSRSSAGSELTAKERAEFQEALDDYRPQPGTPEFRRFQQKLREIFPPKFLPLIEHLEELY